MASKRRIRRRQCSGKRRFETPGLASEAMHALIKAGKKRHGWLHIYRCKFCNGYHFGHAPSTRS